MKILEPKARPGLPDGIPIFKPKIPIWVNFGGSPHGRRWYILRLFGLFYGQLVYFKAIWYFLWSSRIIFSCFGMLYLKNLATQRLEPRARLDKRFLKICFNLSFEVWKVVNSIANGQKTFRVNFLYFITIATTGH
jgi:hypothetical protein